MKQLTPYGRKARKAMIDQGMTLRELAEMLPNSKTGKQGITRQYLSDIFLGKREAPEQKQVISEILKLKKS